MKNKSITKELCETSLPWWGKNIDNIKEAIKTISPHGIDISTGLKQSNIVMRKSLKILIIWLDEIS